MEPQAHLPYPRTVEMAGLKKLLRKVAGPLAAGAAIATGNPQLAVAAYGAGKSATKKKAKVEAPVEPIAPPSWIDTLTPGDRNALLIGGAVVGTLLFSKLLVKR